MKFFKPTTLWRWLQGFIFVAILFGTQGAQAAPLMYNSDFTVSLASPAVNFTIKSGSVADTVVVNSGNVVATISNSTGGSFMLTSVSSDLLVGSTNGGFGTVRQSCSFGVAQVVISVQSGSVTYTVSPTASQCVSGGGGGGGAVSFGGGGGGGGGGGYVAPPPSPTPSLSLVTTTTTATVSNPPSSLQNQLNDLTASLQKLITRQFVRNLSLGSRGDDVKSLQLFLINQNSGSSAQKLAVVGANGYFGPLTKRALMEFQRKAGIRPANGNFGPKTRAYIKNSGVGQ